MPDINLLPDELRKKEEAERQAAPKPTPPPFTWREPTLVKSTQPPHPPALPRQISPEANSGGLKPQPRQIPPAANHAEFKSPPRPTVPPSPPLKMTAPMQQPRMRPSAQPSIGVDLLAASDGAGGASSVSFFHVATTSIIVIGVTLTLLVGGWLLLRQAADARANRADELERERVVVRQKLAEVTQSMEAMKNLAERLRTVRTLLNNHPSVGKLFTFLEQETHANVQFTSVVLRPEENKVNLEVITLDIPSLVGQLLHWAGKRDVISRMTVTSVTRQERPDFVGPIYAFDTTLEFQPSFFRPFAAPTAP